LKRRKCGFFFVDSRYFLGPMSVSFTMKIRGVPFEAGEKEVFEVK